MLTSSPSREQTGRCRQHIRGLSRTFRTQYRRGVFHHTKVGMSVSLLFKGEEGRIGSYSRACGTLTLALLHREQALTGLLTLKRGALISDTELLIFSFPLPLSPSLSFSRSCFPPFPFLPRSLDQRRGRRGKMLKKRISNPSLQKTRKRSSREN